MLVVVLIAVVSTTALQAQQHGRPSKGFDERTVVVTASNSIRADGDLAG
jgi:hypothetical protein